MLFEHLSNGFMLIPDFLGVVLLWHFFFFGEVSCFTFNALHISLSKPILYYLLGELTGTFKC